MYSLTDGPICGIPKAARIAQMKVLLKLGNRLPRTRPRNWAVRSDGNGLSLVPLGESANRYANPIRRARSVHYSALRRVGMQVAKCLQLVHPAAKTSLELRSAFQGVWLDAQSSSTIRSVHLSSRGPQVLKRLNRRLSLSCYRSLRQSSCWPKRRSHIIGIL